MMTLLYRLIALLLLIFVGRDFMKEEAPSLKINACMVMAPLVLRVLMIK
ncbi:MAG: hypothetical protein HFF41_00895 [Lawsonibacter sp.]|jgi:hypothetical protein|nr:hypothetical protein [Lawsonibacter sp.]